MLELSNIEEYKIVLVDAYGKGDPNNVRVPELFNVHRLRITKDNIGMFTKVDNRVGSETFKKETDWLKEEMIKYSRGENTWPDHPERYDLTVITFDANKKPWFSTDGSHRLEVLKETLADGTIEGFDIILIPDTMIPCYSNNCWEQLYSQNRLIDKLLSEAKIPLWIKKYDIGPLDNGEWIGWSNELIINSGGKNQKMLSIPEYKRGREPQPK